MYQPYCFSWIQASTLAAQTTTAIKPKLSSPVYKQPSPESMTRQNMSNNIYQKDTDGWLANTTAGHWYKITTRPQTFSAQHVLTTLQRVLPYTLKEKMSPLLPHPSGVYICYCCTEVKTAPKVFMWHLFIKYVFIFLVKKIGKHKIR